MTERVYCSEESLAIGESLHGTADHVHVWLLLEYRATWRERALEDNDLPETARAWLERSSNAAAAAGLKPRVQFIRRSDRPGAPSNLYVALADDRQSRLYHFRLDDYGSLDDIDVGDLLQASERYDEHRQSEPLILVCTNGQRDLCCARFGRPVFDYLNERFGERVWQTTHLGGHRFAPNVALMPEGLVYGRVNLDAVDALMDAHYEGRMKPELLRGRSCYAAPVQAAEYFLRSSSGIDHIAAFHLVSTEALDDDHFTVVFHDADGHSHVVKVERGSRSVLASCRDEAPKPVDTYTML